MRTAPKHFCLCLLSLVLSLSPLIAADPGPNVRFVMPSAAKADPERREHYLIERPQYTLSYNAKTRRPNWLSWRLRKADIGKPRRRSTSSARRMTDSWPG